MTPSAAPGLREPLSRDRVVATAMGLADEDGIDGLSMRKLAQALGVEAMSLYHHVANKDDLLDGMVDAVFAEVELPKTDGKRWRAPIRARCVSMRAVLLRHPWAVGRLNSRRSPGIATLEHHDVVAGCLRAGGFSVRATASAFATLDAYVYGFVLQELSLPIELDQGPGDLAEEILGGLPEGALPHLAELAANYVTRPDYTFANEFAPGLDLILDGLERARQERPM